MKPTRMLLGVLVLLGAATAAQAFGRGYSTYYPTYSYAAPCYTQGHCYTPYSNPGYGYAYTATSYGPWAYWPYPGTPYYYRTRYVTTGGNRSLENDTWLYTLANGCYSQHCLIADYQKPQVALVPTANLALLGQTQYGTDPLQHLIARAYGPQAATLIPPLRAPNPVDVASLLAPLSTEGPARLESSFKQTQTASETYARIVGGEQDLEKQKLAARNDLIKQSNRYQSLERILGKMAEFDAVSEKQAQIGLQAAATQIQVADPTLAQIIGTSCFNCHGGSKVEKGVDFRQAGSFDARQWQRVYQQVISGAMPRGGPPLDQAAIDLFEDQYFRVRTAGGNGR
jgi:hypothetical protein